MCGIVGIKADSVTPDFINAVYRIAVCTQDRGRDGFGLVLQQAGIRHSIHQLSFDGEALMAFLRQHILVSHPLTVVMSSRAQPLPEADSTIKNLQPYMGDRWSLVHNGTISNDRVLADDMGIAHPGVDTMVVHELWERQDQLDTSRLVGGYAFLVIDKHTDELHFLKNFKTLWFTRGTYKGTSFACAGSEPDWLTMTFGAQSLGELPLERIPTYTRGFIHPKGTQLTKLHNDYWSSTPILQEDKAIVVVSGGIDSVTAAYIATKLHHRQVTLLHCDYGHRSREREKEAVIAIADDLKVPVIWADHQALGELGASPLTDRSIQLPLGMASVESTLCWTPARNLLFLAMAAAVAEAHGAKWIYYGNNMEEEATGYGDNDLEFVEMMNVVLQYATLRGVQIKRALARLMKPEILHIGTFLGVPFDKTWSCDEGFDLPCGECGCCTTRRYAFERAGLADEQQYLHSKKDSYPWTGSRTFNINNLLEVIK